MSKINNIVKEASISKVANVAGSLAGTTNIGKQAIDIASGLFNFPRIDSDLTAWFVVDGKEYELANFNIGFGQSVDFKGQPQNEVRGGRMLVSLTEALPESMYEWAMTTNPKNGTVEFRSKTVNSPLKIEFTNAFCVNFNRIIDSNNGLITNLIISPEEIVINGMPLDNYWVK